MQSLKPLELDQIARIKYRTSIYDQACAEMKTQLLQRNCLLRLASGVLLVGMIFQLGACPCGCLEHNVWVQLLGLDADHHLGRTASASTVSWSGLDADHHNCTGEPRPGYVDNARSFRVAGLCHKELIAVADPSADRVIRSLRSSEHAGPRSPGPAVSHALTRSTLQVYRL